MFESIPLDSSHTWERVLCHTAFRHMLRRNGMTRGEIKVLWLRVREEIYKYFHAAGASSAHARYVATEARRGMCAAAARALGKQLITLHEAMDVNALAERFSCDLHTQQDFLTDDHRQTSQLKRLLQLQQRAVGNRRAICFVSLLEVSVCSA